MSRAGSREGSEIITLFNKTSTFDNLNLPYFLFFIHFVGLTLNFFSSNVRFYHFVDFFSVKKENSSLFPFILLNHSLAVLYLFFTLIIST